MTPWPISTRNRSLTLACGPAGASTARSTNHSATVSPTTTQARSACSWAMVFQSTGIRRTVYEPLDSPGCGPAPLTRVPTTMSTAVGGGEQLTELPHRLAHQRPP